MAALTGYAISKWWGSGSESEARYSALVCAVAAMWAWVANLQANLEENQDRLFRLYGHRWPADEDEEP